MSKKTDPLFRKLDNLLVKHDLTVLEIAKAAGSPIARFVALRGERRRVARRLGMMIRTAEKRGEESAGLGSFD